MGSKHHPFWFYPFSALFRLHFNIYYYLAKDHWWGFNTRNAHMVHIVNSIQKAKVFFVFRNSLFGYWWFNSQNTRMVDIFQSKTEVLRDVWNLKVWKQNKFRRDWSQHYSTCRYQILINGGCHCIWSSSRMSRNTIKKMNQSQLNLLF